MKHTFVAALPVLPVAFVALFFLLNQMYFSFFHTNLTLAALGLARTAVDATSSITELVNATNLSVLLVAPIAIQIAVLRALRGGASARPISAGVALFCAGLVLAGLAAATRHPVFVFADHNPAMSLGRQAGASIWDELICDDDGEGRLERLSGDVLSLFNREAYAGYELAGDPDHPLLQRAAAGEAPSVPPLNVVVILMESMRGFEMQGDFRELPVTPALNALEEQSLVFPTFYYNGMTTVDAEFAILCSALPLVDSVPIYIQNHELRIRCLPEILRERGYSTHWVSAYRASYANKRRFLERHGVSQIHDQKTMDPRRIRHPRVGWGMGDVDMFEQAIEKIDGFQEPFFAEIMTLSNHHPFSHDYDLAFPEAMDEVRGNQHYRDHLKGMYYTDHAVGRFLEDARTRPWFGRTLFVILGDHAVRAYPPPKRGVTLGPVLESEIYFRGHLILYAPGHLAPGTRDVLGSQIDVAPTILDILGVRTDNSFLGVSLLSELAPDRRFALMTIGHVWNMRIGNHYCYSVGYSCFEKVFPRCGEGVKPTFEGHTCFELPGDLLATAGGRPQRSLDALERFRVLDRAERIIDINRLLIEQDRF